MPVLLGGERRGAQVATTSCLWVGLAERAGGVCRWVAGRLPQVCSMDEKREGGREGRRWTGLLGPARSACAEQPLSWLCWCSEGSVSTTSSSSRRQSLLAGTMVGLRDGPVGGGRAGRRDAKVRCCVMGGRGADEEPAAAEGRGW